MSLVPSANGSADPRQALLFAAERGDRLVASSNRAIGSRTSVTPSVMYFAVCTTAAVCLNEHAPRSNVELSLTHALLSLH